MKIFLKIGLPWAVTMGLVFYLGLYLGTSNKKKDYQQLSLPSSQPGSQTVSSISEEMIAARTAENKSLQRQTQTIPTPPPPMPPNLQRIMQGGDIVERLGSYLDAVRSMDRSNVKRVIQAFEELPSGYGRHLEMKLLMRSWSNFDPEAALAYASNSLDAMSERRFGISEALAGWAVKDKKAAVTWAHNHNPDKSNNNNPLLVGIVKGLIETDLKAANELFLSLPPGSTRWQASSLLADKFASQGIDHAIHWAKQYPTDDPRMRETVLAQMGAKLAKKDLEATAQWVKSMNPEPGAKRAMENLIDQWATHDPTGAANWIDQLTQPAKKMHAIEQLTHRWASIDPVATAQWLNSQPSSPKLDPAIATFVARIKDRDPEGAADWAQSISDSSLRAKTTERILDAWKRKDPQKASSWIEGLSE